MRLVLLPMLLAGCHAASSANTDITTFSGTVHLSGMATWSTSPSMGATDTGTETIDAACTLNADGTAHYVATVSDHQVLTDSNGSSTTDATGMFDMVQAADDVDCGGDLDTTTGDWSVSISFPSILVTGTRKSTETGGNPTSQPIPSSDWSLFDPALFSAETYDFQGANPSGSAGAVDGMQQTSTSDIPGNAHAGMATITWALSPVQ